MVVVTGGGLETETLGWRRSLAENLVPSLDFTVGFAPILVLIDGLVRGLLLSACNSQDLPGLLGLPDRLSPDVVSGEDFRLHLGGQGGGRGSFCEHLSRGLLLSKGNRRVSGGLSSMRLSSMRRSSGLGCISRSYLWSGGGGGGGLACREVKLQVPCP